MSEKLLVDDTHAGIRILTINRPERLNALDGDTLTTLGDALRESAEPARDIRVVVLRGTGRAFSTGSDLKWLASGVLADPAAHLRNQDRMAAVHQHIESCGQVVIACVNGLALAGGLEMALACDIVVADEAAELGDEHIRKNLLPTGGSSQRLPRKIGPARGLYYLLTGRRMSGREAERIGLVSLAVPAAELEAATLAMAVEIAGRDPYALANMKRMARHGMELPLQDGLWLERWTNYRYRNESPSMMESVLAFAGGKGRS